MRRLLAIDDEPPILRCIKHALRSRGYEMSITDDPFKGLEMLKTDQDIILALLDINMPRLSGFDIYRSMRQCRKLPVLFVTACPQAFNAKDDELTAMWQNEFADGTTDIIYKPFSVQTLCEKVEGLIGEPQQAGE